MGAKTRRRRLTLLLLGLIAPLAPAVAYGDSAPLQRFFGQYVGEAVADAEGDLDKRDIRAEISPLEKGFTVRWIMVVRKASGKTKRDDYSLNFVPTQRPNIYSSAMRTNAFGNAVPLDPLRGDPYVWARVEGSTLMIHALIVTDTGGYELHVYERTLTPTGMSLKFSRVVDGRVLRTATGTLKKTR